MESRTDQQNQSNTLLNEMSKGGWNARRINSGDLSHFKDLLCMDVSTTSSPAPEVEGTLLELLNVSVRSLFFRIELVSAEKTLPVLTFEMRDIYISARNWSSSLRLECHIELEAAAFNEYVGGWEPLIEQTEEQYDSIRTVPWQLEIVIGKRMFNDVGSLVDIRSTRRLEITLTISTISLMYRIRQQFYKAVDPPSKATLREIDSDSYVRLENRLNEEFELGLKGDLRVVADPSAETLIVQPNSIVQLFSEKLSRVQNSIISQFANHFRQDINIRLLTEPKSHSINVSRPLPRIFNVDKNLKMLYESFADAPRKIVLRSIIKIVNACPVNMTISTGSYEIQIPSKSTYYPSLHEANDLLTCTLTVFIDAGQTLHTQIQKCEFNKEIPLVFSDVSNQLPSQILSMYILKESAFIANSDRKDAARYTLSVRPFVQITNLLPLSLTLTDPVTILNAGQQICLLDKSPQLSSTIPIQYVSCDVNGDPIKVSGVIDLSKCKKRIDVVKFSTHRAPLGDLDTHLAVLCETNIADPMKPSICLKIFAPYWITNATKLPLIIRLVDYDRIEKEIPILNDNDSRTDSYFPLIICGERIDKGQRRAQVAAKGNSESRAAWSSRFSLDAVGSVGSLTVKQHANSQVCRICVNITYSSCGLTKIISLTPYFTICNKTSEPVEIRECSFLSTSLNQVKFANCEWIRVESNSCVPFWPKGSSDEDLKCCLVVRHTDRHKDSMSRPFLYRRAHSTLLRMMTQSEIEATNLANNTIFVECFVTELKSDVIFSPYMPGQTPLLLVNCSDNYELIVGQEETCSSIRVPAKSIQFFIWTEPILKRNIHWTFEKYEKRNVDLTEDEGSFIVHERIHMKWKLFIISNQRVLAITEQTVASSSATRKKGHEQIEKNALKVRFKEELRFSIQLFYIGLSLVDEKQRQEILYISMRSSAPQWYQDKRALVPETMATYKRIADVPLEQAIENAYQIYVKSSRTDMDALVQLDQRRTIDFKCMELIETSPGRLFLKDSGAQKKRYLHRLDIDAFKFTYQKAKAASYFNLRVFRVQVDNQVDAAVFPVTLYSALHANANSLSANRAMIEASMLIHHTATTSPSDLNDDGFVLIDYFSVLVQEFAIKADQGLLANILCFLLAFTDPNLSSSSCLKDDLAYSRRNLRDIMDDEAIGRTGKQIYFKKCHIQPLKVHVSFSMQTSLMNRSEDLLSKYPAIEFFLQTLNIAEFEDVVLELNSYERRNYFTNTNLIQAEIIEHYRTQALKRIYVFVLGLDVLGNPFGLIREVREGFESVFYEPYKGAILGPTEFTAGLVQGFRDLVGGIVGGTTGAFSKITESLGKGIAQLTFDDQHKLERLRDRQQSYTIGQSIAQGGKRVFSEFYDGLTGVVRKPIEGARESGTEGFIKGLSKGVIGLVARPVGGVVDFTSTSLQGVKRLTTQENVVDRVRLPRFIDFDCIVRCFKEHEAEGNYLLTHVENGSLAKTNNYIAHILCSLKPRQWLAATNKFLLMIAENTMIAQFNLDFKVAYEDVKDMYTSVDEHGMAVITIMTEERRLSIFKKDFVCGKTIHVISLEHAKWMCNKVAEILHDRNFTFPRK